MTISEKELIFITLKKALKNRGKTYRDLAKFLSISEISVKRCFSKREIGLDRLFKISQFLEISFFDLMASAQKTAAPNYEFSFEEEKFFTNNFDAFLFYRRLETFRSLKEFQKEYPISSSITKKYLHKLNQLGIIETTDDTIRFKYQGHLRINHSSKLSSKIKSHWSHELLKKAQEKKDDDHRTMIFSTLLSEKNKKVFYDELQVLFEKYIKLGHLDATFSHCSALGVSLVTGPYRVGEIGEII